MTESILTRGQRQYKRDKTAYKERTAKWLSQPGNKERALAKAREYKQKHRTEIREQRRCRRQNDPIKKIADSCRTRLREIFLGRGGRRHGKPIKKMDKTIRLIGCSYLQLKSHLESRFTSGMTWDNYGRGEGKWVIDHIIPICSFDLRIKENQYKAFHYSNLQPLWWKKNEEKIIEDKKTCFRYE